MEKSINRKEKEIFKPKIGEQGGIETKSKSQHQQTQYLLKVTANQSK